VIVDPADARVRILELTEIGRRLMFDSLDVMADLENRYAKLIGSKTLRATLDGLEAFNNAADQIRPLAPADWRRAVSGD